MSTQWKIKELHPESIWGKFGQFEKFQLDRPIVEIIEQRDMAGEFLFIEATFSPVENDEFEVMNSPFCIAGVILEEI